MSYRWQAGTLPNDLYLDPLPSRKSITPKHPTGQLCVVDDWPERVPVTPEEVEVFERWFGKLLDELLAKQSKR